MKKPLLELHNLVSQEQILLPCGKFNLLLAHFGTPINGVLYTLIMKDTKENRSDGTAVLPNASNQKMFLWQKVVNQLELLNP
jgi:hypothetical protein